MARGPLVRRALVAMIVLAVVNVPVGIGAEDAPLFGFDPGGEVSDPFVEWVDPAVTYDYAEEDLVPTPEFDFTELHDSDVFAAGVDWVEVDDDSLADFEAPHIRARQVQLTAARDVESITARVDLLRPRVQSLSDEIAYEQREEERLADEIATYKMAIAEFAVRAFIGDEELSTALAIPSSEIPENRVLTDEVRDSQFAAITVREAELAERQTRRARLKEDRRTVRGQIRWLQSQRLSRLEDIRQLSALVERTASDYRTALHARLTEMVRGSDIPLVALNAYVIAERTMAVERPRCGIGWWMLAGIGRIESQHGHFGDSTLDANGYATVAITGPALDGRILEGAEFLTAGMPVPEPTTATAELPIATPPPPADPVAGPADDATIEEPVIKRLALIGDTDGGLLDGDSRYDRAVGPMQFIPQTWRTYETDGNHDDEMEPQNIYDASLASARYLCTAAGSLTTKDGQERAYFAYNHDEAYSIAVEEAASMYRRRISIPDDAGSAAWLGLAEIPVDDVRRDIADAVQDLDLSELPDW